MRIHPLIATVAVSAFTLAACSSNSDESFTPPSLETTPRMVTSADSLVVDPSPYTEEELARAERLLDAYTRSYRANDFTTTCLLEVDTTYSPVELSGSLKNLEECVHVNSLIGQAIRRQALDLATEFEATDIGDGMAMIAFNGHPDFARVARLSNGELYVDIAYWHEVDSAHASEVQNN